MTNTPIYAIWRGMIVRCTDPDHPAYPRYGGRGITVCPEWLSFKRFYADFGHTRPSRAHSIDRRENNDGYHIGNVRWALPVVQQNNRSNNHRIEFDGQSLTVAQWSRRIGVTASALSRRIRVGWPVELALTLPSDPNRRVVG